MKKQFAAAAALALISMVSCGNKVVPNATVKVETGDALPESYIEGSGSTSAVGTKKIKTTKWIIL